MKNYIIIALSFLLVLLAFRSCATDKLHEAKQAHDKQRIDSLSGLNELNELEVAISKNEIKRLTDIKTPKVELLYQTKYLTQYVRLHDTFNQRFTDSNYCKNIEVENGKLWEVYGIDSVLIVNYKKVVSNQDSIINRDSVMMAICEGAWKREETQRRKSDAKLNHKSFWLEAWRGIAIASIGVLTVIGLSK
jgi:hypothetical protein